jgi:uncharacterized membrane protein YphA (DoxX/SURF4 family)
MKIVREIVRILLGATFVFSGFVKGIDPLGSAYKFTDYFSAFGTDWAGKFSLALSIILALAEFGIGIALLLNYRVKFFAWLCLFFMAFFLPFTLWIALKNPVTDCGCFGDAFVISNWETFYKNIVLIAFAIIVFVSRTKYKNKLNIQLQNGSFIFFLLLLGFVQYYGLNHLPLIDFRPYKIGNNIAKGMAMPAGAPKDIFKNEFIYKNKQTGKTQKFNETNYPWQDSLHWQYINMKSKLVKKGYHPSIHDFTIENGNGDNVADFYLGDRNYTLMLIASNLQKSNKKRQEQINELASRAIKEGWNFICLTSSDGDEITQFTNEYKPPYEFFFCDEITLKTMIRSNPGLILTKEGTIIDNWHWHDIPTFDNLLK